MAGLVGEGVCVYTRGTRGQSQQATHAAVPVGLGVVWVACAKNEWLTQLMNVVETRNDAPFMATKKAGGGGVVTGRVSRYEARGRHAGPCHAGL